MAFVTPTLLPTSKAAERTPVSRTVRQRHLRICACEHSPSETPYTLGKPHPYGNGNIDMTLDWTGWDPQKLAREVQEAEELLKTFEPKLSCWRLVVNPEMILHNNNLWEESVKEGFSADLSGLVLLPVMEPDAAEKIEKLHENIWVIVVNGQDIQLTTRSGETVVLCFERDDEARAYANELRDGMVNDPNAVDMEKRSPYDMRSQYESQGTLLGIVPAFSPVTPSLVEKYL